MRTEYWAHASLGVPLVMTFTVSPSTTPTTRQGSTACLNTSVRLGADRGGTVVKGGTVVVLMNFDELETQPLKQMDPMNQKL
jgi:hypothetical protein